MWRIFHLFGARLDSEGMVFIQLCSRRSVVSDGILHVLLERQGRVPERCIRRQYFLVRYGELFVFSACAGIRASCVSAVLSKFASCYRSVSGFLTWWLGSKTSFSGVALIDNVDVLTEEYLSSLHGIAWIVLVGCDLWS